MTDYLNAAQTLIRQLRVEGNPAPAQAHSVWVRAETVEDEDGKLRATGKQELCVSIRPGWQKKIAVPEFHEGIPVVNVPWPKGS